ncbi:MAG: hypothetical protein O3C19_05705 [Bacteroidetes bacterium]|nr:hypothetical protein [Bacteroidota bacterium]
MSKTAEQLLAESLNLDPLTVALEKFKIFSDAVEAIAGGKSYEITSGAGASRKLTRLSPDEVMRLYNYYKSQVEELSQGCNSLAPKFLEIQTAG